MSIKLPAWAGLAVDGAITVDASVVYPMYLKRLGFGVPPPADEALGQLWLEIARRCFSADLFDIVWSQGVNHIHLRILKGDGTWRLANWTAVEGMDLDQAARLSWRKFYKRLDPPIPLEPALELYRAALAAWDGKGAPPKLPKHPLARAACEAYRDA